MQKQFIHNTNSKILDLGKIKDIETLKSFGTYADVKIHVEEKIGVSLNVNDWDQLLKTINNLSFSVNKNIEKLTFVLTDNKHLKELGSFSEAKRIISQLLSFPMTARSWERLESQLKTIVLAFSHHELTDKSVIFEKNKIRNFVNSSRLEGIQISDIPILKMADVINKYRVH